MIIDNFEQIKQLLIFENSDWFYHCQILLRRKDMPEAAKGRNNNSRCIKTYYITSIEQLEFYKNEIIKLCTIFGARAYINLNSKSYIKTAFEMNIKVAERMKNKQFEYIYRCYESAAGMSDVNVGNIRWIVDIDEKDISPLMLSYIEYQCAPFSNWTYNVDNDIDAFNSKILAKIPTKSGWHLITKPFNLQQFKQQYSNIEVQKNNPTLLYFEYED